MALENTERTNDFERAFAKREIAQINGTSVEIAASETVLSQLDTKYEKRKNKSTTDT